MHDVIVVVKFHAFGLVFGICFSLEVIVLGSFVRCDARLKTFGGGIDSWLCSHFNKDNAGLTMYCKG